MRKCYIALLSKSCLSFIDGDDADKVAGIMSSQGRRRLIFRSTTDEHFSGRDR